MIAEPDDDTEDEEDSEEGGGELSLFTELKTDPGKLGLETLLDEITKLGRVRAIGLPDGLFADVAEKRITRWRARAVAEYPSTLRRDHPREVALTLLAVLCWCRLTELTDSLVELFCDLVRAINTRAERRVDKKQIAEFRRVGDKQNVLFTMAGAAVEHPDDSVRDAVYPVVGEQTLKDLVAEAEATESRRRARVRTVLTGSSPTTLARDHRGHFLVYDDAMQRIGTDAEAANRAISIAEDREWPDRLDWEQGPDALRYPGLYDTAEDDEDQDEDDLEPLDLRQRDPAR